MNEPVRISDVISALRSMQQLSNRFDPWVFTIAIVASLVASLIAAWFYKFFYENRGTGSQVYRAFPLLSISITCLFIGIQTSLPLSLGLLGALSIIRFRTPIKEPEEVGFIMLVIASSISCATFNFQFLVILNIVALLILFALRSWRRWNLFGHDGLIIITVADKQDSKVVETVGKCISTCARNSRLESSSCKSGMTYLQFSFSGLRINPTLFHDRLRETDPSVQIQVFFDRPGSI